MALALLFFNIIYDVVFEYAINDIIQLFIKIKPRLIIYIIKSKKSIIGVYGILNIIKNI